MGKTFFKTALFLTIAVVIAGCSGYNKLLKSKNPELMYAKALEFYEKGKYNKTIQLLEEVVHYFSGTMRDDSVAYYLATSYYKSGDFESSSLLLDNFRQTFTNSPFLEDAEYMYAKGFYYMSPAPNRDQTATRRALIAIDEYIERYPNSVKKEAMEENVVELREKLHDKAFINAKSYYTTGRYKAATVALKNALNQYPETKHREEILYLTAKSHYLLASNSVEYMQRDRFLEMMDSYFNYVSEYPDSKNVKELEKMRDDARKYLAKFTDLNTIQSSTENNNDTDNGN